MRFGRKLPSAVTASRAHEFPRAQFDAVQTANKQNQKQTLTGKSVHLYSKMSLQMVCQGRRLAVWPGPFSCQNLDLSSQAERHLTSW